MRNLKKVLSLVLCLAMMLSIMVVGAGAAFTDQGQFDGRYAEASEVLSNLSVLKGYEDGSFKPKGEITRAEVAAMIYRIATGDVTDAKVSGYAADNQFKDVKSDDWFAGYVNYCASVGYIKGYGDGNFGPQDKVTGYQALAMILRAMGYDQKDEFTGSQWILNTAATAESRGILQNVRGEDLNVAAVRELVAELIFQSMVIPTVTYTPALGYNQYDSIVVNGSNHGNLNPTLGEKAFGLQKTAGEITAVGRTAGTTELITSAGKNTVEGTDTSWTDIGYGAYVWTVATSGAKTRTAVSDVVITGESLGVSTDGTSYCDLTDKTDASFLAGVDKKDGFNVYYNGVRVPVNNQSAQLRIDGENVNVLDRIGNRGVKVDFIDNDGQGLAEAVVITEYTTAVITGVATDSSTAGISATVASSVYYTTRSNTSNVKAANIVSDSSLAVDDIVTYVDYKGLDAESTRYTYESTGTVATLSQIARDRETNTYYVLGGENLYTSEITDFSVAALSVANVGKQITYYVDEYGYVIKADLYTAPSQYAFGVSNSHTDGNTKLASGYVVYADGSVANVPVAKVNNVSDLANNVIAKNLYTYTSDAAGAYTLNTAGTVIDTVSHAKNSTSITLNGTKYYVNNQTVVVDVTDVLAGTASAATVYTGTANIPAMDYAKGAFVAANGYVSLAFVYDYGTIKTDRFMVYDISENIVSTDSNGVTTYTLNVVRDGVKGTVTLSKAAFEEIVKASSKTGYGVGIYETVNGQITGYTSYAEVMSNLAWGENTILDGVARAPQNKVESWENSYSYTDDTTVTVLNITEGTVTTFGTLQAGQAYIHNSLDNAQGFVEADKGVAEHIYFVVGEKATAQNNHHVINEPALNGSVTSYYVKDHFITGVYTSAAETHDIYIDGLYYQSVESGKTITLPNGTVGTGYSLNGTYYAYGASYTVPVSDNSDEIHFTSGFVKFTIDDDVAKPVKFSNTHVNVKDLIGDKAGTYVWSDWGTGRDYNSVATGTHVPNRDHDITTGFFKVVANLAEYEVTVDGVAVTESPVYVTANQVVIAKKIDGSAVTQYGAGTTNPITSDISIG